VVISRRFELDCDASALDVYRILRTTNPSPYMYLFSLEDADGREYSIVGSSPEALVTVTGDEVITHPIAGSRPRGAALKRTGRLAEETDGRRQGEGRAPHARRTWRATTSRRSAGPAASTSPSSWRSNGSATSCTWSPPSSGARPGESAYDVLAGTVPRRTLSGAPKPRALRLIDELEPHRRGIYGGVVGYLDFAGDMDLAIAIRSALLRGGRAYVQSGGGIVADSVLEAEALETVNKAAAPLRAALTASDLRPAMGLDTGAVAAAPGATT
jgi:anthranilate synthase component 1